MRHRCSTALLAAASMAMGCNQAPPSWQQLLAARIVEQYPGYTTSPVEGGQLIVHRPGQPEVRIDVNAIAQFCQRGPEDCNYATDQMLLQLRRP